MTLTVRSSGVYVFKKACDVPQYILDECSRENYGEVGNLRDWLYAFVDSNIGCLVVNLCVGHVASWCIVHVLKDESRKCCCVSIWTVRGFRRLGYASEIIKEIERRYRGYHIDNFKYDRLSRNFWDKNGW